MQAAKPSRRSRWRVLAPVAVLVVSLILIQMFRVSRAVNRLQQDVATLQSLTTNGTLTASQSNLSDVLDAQLTQTVQDFREVRGDVDGLVYLAPFFGWLPRYGGDLADAPALMDFGDRISTSAQDLLAINRALNAEIDAGRASSTPIGVSVLRGVQSQRALIEQARQDLAATTQARGQIDATRLSPSLQAMTYRFDRYLPVWQAGLDMLADAPTLLGADRPRVYLLVAQNSDELRATGGFITGVSLLRIDQGKITVSNYRDSYSVDDLSKPHPAAPEPLRRYMYAYYWTFRDANWSPDFPTAARQLQAMYQIDQGVTADGVIALNQKLIPRLLQATGPVTIPEYNERVDAANVMAKIQEYWASPQGIGKAADWWAHRKDFTGKLFEAMMNRFTTGNLDRAQLAAALVDGLMSKDLLVYVNDASDAGLSRLGALTTDPGDALMIVDSNVGFNKVDGNVQRQADYAVTLDAAGAMRATLTITYTNLSNPVDAFCVHQPYYLNDYAELQQGCYWDYVRAVVPAGAELYGATPDLEASAESLPISRTSFGGYFFIARGETTKIQFEYGVPALLKGQSGYTLRLQKQPGAPPMPVRVRVTLPPGWRAVSASPAPYRIAGNTVEFNVTLDRDQEIQVDLDKSAVPLGNLVAGAIGLGVAGGLGAVLYRRRRKNAAIH